MNIPINKPPKSEKKISVFLDKAGEPKVKIDSMVWGRANMTWVRDPESEDFEFVSMTFLKNPNPLGEPDVHKKKITLLRPDMNAPQARGEWSYIITVQAGGTQFTSIETDEPEGDRPVIRN